MSQPATIRTSANTPVRLKVAYKRPEALLSEYTRRLGLGGVTLQTQRSVPPGTRFVFELHNLGVPTPVEVLGEVVQVMPRPNGRYQLTVRYNPGENRGGLDAVLKRLLDTQREEQLRKHARVPLRLSATEDVPFSPTFLVKDLSRGGAGLEVEAPALPPKARVGVAFLMEVELNIGTLKLPGEVSWVRPGRPDALPGFGVNFHTLTPENAERLERLLALEAMPTGLRKPRVSFGMEAVKRQKS